MVGVVAGLAEVVAGLAEMVAGLVWVNIHTGMWVAGLVWVNIHTGMWVAGLIWVNLHNQYKMRNHEEIHKMKSKKSNLKQKLHIS